MTSSRTQERSSTSGKHTLQSTKASRDSPVVRAFGMLEYLARSRGPMRLSTIAKELELQKSTVHRMLGLLVNLGYAQQVPDTGCYCATLKLWEAGQAVVAEHPVKRVAAAFLPGLHRATRETVSLTILSGDDVLYLDKLIAPRPARFLTRVGSRVPALLTAGGKAMIAHDPDAGTTVKRIVAKLGRERGLKVESIMCELQRARQQGYATSKFDAGVISLAAPIMGHDGRAAAAMTVSAPVQRVDARRKAELIEQLLNTSAEIGERVGAL